MHLLRQMIVFIACQLSIKLYFFCPILSCYSSLTNLTFFHALLYNSIKPSLLHGKYNNFFLLLILGTINPYTNQKYKYLQYLHLLWSHVISVKSHSSTFYPLCWLGSQHYTALFSSGFVVFNKYTLVYIQIQLIRLFTFFPL